MPLRTQVGMSGAYLLRVNLHSANLSGANLSQAVLHTVNLREADLNGVSLQSCTFQAEVDLRGAYLTWAQIEEAASHHRFHPGVIKYDQNAFPGGQETQEGQS